MKNQLRHLASFLEPRKALALGIAGAFIFSATFVNASFFSTGSFASDNTGTTQTQTTQTLNGTNQTQTNNQILIPQNQPQTGSIPLTGTAQPGSGSLIFGNGGSFSNSNNSGNLGSGSIPVTSQNTDVTTNGNLTSNTSNPNDLFYATFPASSFHGFFSSQIANNATNGTSGSSVISQPVPISSSAGSSGSGSFFSNNFAQGSFFNGGSNISGTSTATTAPLTIIAYGDSLVSGVGATSGNDFVTLLANRVGMPIVNDGMNGATTATALQNLNSAVISRHPDIVILLIGGNDILQGVPQQTTYSNIQSIVTQIQQNGGHVILLGLGTFLNTLDFNTGYSQVAQATGATFVPNTLQGILDNTSLLSDSVHPNDQGQALMAERVAPTLQSVIQSVETDNNQGGGSGSGGGTGTSSAITVTSPNGGEQWALGSTHTITWSAPSSISGVDLYLIRSFQSMSCAQNSNGTQCLTPLSLPSIQPLLLGQNIRNTGSVNWNVGMTASGAAAPGTYQIYIRDTNNANVFDQSNNAFTITDANGGGGSGGGGTTTQNLQITSPHGGEVWQTGTTHVISWTGDNGPANIYLAGPGSCTSSADCAQGASAGNLLVIAAGVTGQSFNWTIPQLGGRGGIFQNGTGLEPNLTLQSYRIIIQSSSGNAESASFTIFPNRQFCGGWYACRFLSGSSSNTAMTGTTSMIQCPC